MLDTILKLSKKDIESLLNSEPYGADDFNTVVDTLISEQKKRNCHDLSIKYEYRAGTFFNPEHLQFKNANRSVMFLSLFFFLKENPELEEKMGMSIYDCLYLSIDNLKKLIDIQQTHKIKTL